MSVDTRAYLQGKIEPEEIAQFLCRHYGILISDIRISRKSISDFVMSENLRNELAKNYSEKQGFWHTEICYIDFLTPQGNRRHIFWCFDTCVFTSSEDFRKQSDYPFTHISLCCDEQGIDIIKAITINFGGYFDENDCDGVDYIAISKNASEGKNEAIKPIFYFTIEELQEHFDGIVKIVSKEEKEKLVQKKIAMKKLTPPTL